MSAADLIVRPALLSDLDTITAIYGRAVLTGTASFEIDPPGDSEMQRRYEAMVAGGHPYLVAELSDVVVGYAYAGPYRPRPAYRSTVEDSIYLADDMQGRGIGRALLAALIDAATAAGFRQMVGVIGDSGHAASIRLHEALGFRMVGTFENVGWKHGRWLDSVLMQRALGDAASRAPDL